MMQHGLDPLNPNVQEAAFYVSHLGSVLKATSSVSNYISGAQSWLELAGGDGSVFRSRLVASVKKGVRNNSTHKTRKALPLSVKGVKLVLDYLFSAGDIGVVPASALLLAYFAALRQSNLLSDSTSLWGGQHTLKRADVIKVKEGLCLLV